MQNNVKNNQYKSIKIIKLLYYTISLISFVLSFFIDSIILLLASLQVVLMIVCFLHELGHIIGCKIIKKNIVKIRVFSISLELGKMKIFPNFNFGGTCTFIKDNRSSKLVYLLGPISSFFTLIFVLFLFLIFQLKILLLLLIVNAITLIITIMPYKYSDVYNFYTEVNHG